MREWQAVASERHLSKGRSVRIVGRALRSGKGKIMYGSPAASVRRSREDSARGIDSLLWLAAGAAWAIVALRAWSQTKKIDARRRTFVVSDRLLKQVFPDGIRH
jgi:hypothetical protein